MFYVYLLQSQKDNTFYIGQTNDTNARVVRHNSGFVQSTKNKIPWILIGFEEYPTRREATWREYSLKKKISEKKKFIQKLISLRFHSSMDRV